MVTSKELEDEALHLLQSNKELILDLDFDELYSRAEAAGVRVYAITSVLIDSGINPLKYVTKIVKHMFLNNVLPPWLKDLKLPQLSDKVIPVQAFWHCEGLESIDLNNAEVVGSQAFLQCKDLKYVNFGNVKRIRHRVFSRCTALESIDLQGVQKTGDATFYGCENLKTIYVSHSTQLGTTGKPEGCKIIRK